MFELGAQHEDDWRKRAECYTQQESVQELNKLLGFDMFYPPSGRTEEALKYSKRFCRVCPVQVACFNAAVEEDEYGTWGGESYSKRRQMVRKYRTLPLVLIEPPLELLQGENMDRIEDVNRDPESA